MHKHRIDKSIFQIDFPNQEVGFEAQAALPDLISKSLMPVVDETFSSNVLPGKVWRIDTLELDLGQFLLHEYQDEMPVRLRQRLHKKLREMRQIILLKDQDQDQTKTLQQSEFELLAAILRKGLMPWNGDYANHASLENLLNKVMLSEPQMLLEFLKKADSPIILERLVKQLEESSFAKLLSFLATEGNRSTDPALQTLIEALLRSRLSQALCLGEPKIIENSWALIVNNYGNLLVEVLREQGRSHGVRRRIAQSFNPAMLSRILQLLEPMEVDFVRDIIEQPGLFLLAAQKLDRRNRQQKGVKTQLWEFTLAYLLIDRGSRFNKETFLESLLERMASHENLQFDSFLQSLLIVLDQSRISSSLKEEMAKLLRTIGRKRQSSTEMLDQDREAPSPTVAKQLEQERIQQGIGFKEILTSALQSGQTSEVKTIWPDLISFHRKMVLQVIRQLGKQARIRKQLAQTFPLTMLRDIIVLVEPSEHRFVEEVIKSASLLRTYHDDNEVGQVARERLLFEFSLAYLLIERGSHFNQKAYLGWMLRRMASQANMAYMELLQTLSLTLERLKTPTRMQKLLFELLGQLRHEDGSLAESKRDAKKASQVSVETVWQEDSEIQATLSRVRLFLLTGQGSSLAPQWLAPALKLLLQQSPNELLTLLTWTLEDSPAIARLSHTLPANLFMEIIKLLRPQWASEIIELADMFTEACRFDDFPLSHQELTRQKYRYILHYLIQEPKPFERSDFIKGFLLFLRQQEPTLNHEIQASICRNLVRDIKPSTKEKQLTIIRVLRQQSDFQEQETIERISDIVSSNTDSEQHTDEEEFLEEISITNSGLVLAAQYLPRLFDILGLTENRDFKDRQTRERGIHLLQYLVNEKVDCPEYQLVLNKVFCGLETGIPIRRSITIFPKEQEIIEDLLKGIIKNWAGIGNTSIAGLRESFLNRHGLLRQKVDSWHLLVEAKPFDMLLDQLPWNFRIIRFPWMSKVLHVDWR